MLEQNNEKKLWKYKKRIEEQAQHTNIQINSHLKCINYDLINHKFDWIMNGDAMVAVEDNFRRWRKMNVFPCCWLFRAWFMCLESNSVSVCACVSTVFVFIGLRSFVALSLNDSRDFGKHKSKRKIDVIASITTIVRYGNVSGLRAFAMWKSLNSIMTNEQTGHIGLIEHIGHYDMVVVSR